MARKYIEVTTHRRNHVVRNSVSILHFALCAMHFAPCALHSPYPPQLIAWTGQVSIASWQLQDPH
jgi:hypothetical protein